MAKAQPTVTILTTHLDGSKVEVEAILVSAGLALHPMPSENGEKPRRAWTITHLESGRHLVTGIRKKTEAQAFFGTCIELAEKSGIDLKEPIEQLVTKAGYASWASEISSLGKQLDVLKSCVV